MFTLLFTAVGRRVQLLRAFREAYVRERIPARIIGVDSTPDMSPAGFFLDAIFPVPRVGEENYIPTLLDICRQQQVDVIIPLYEQEFFLLDAVRQDFAAMGTLLLLSERPVLEICQDKWTAFQFFRDHQVLTPETKLLEGYEPVHFPVFVKPRCGAGSVDAVRLDNIQQYRSYISRLDEKTRNDTIIQTYIHGIEYTIDALVDLSGAVLAIVPRQRLEVRAGEVTKSITIDRPDLIEETCKLIALLPPGTRGPLTIQCIDTGRQIYWIEINPRFGGGVPLSIAAGVDYPMLLYRMWQGERLESNLGQYEKKMLMLRFDDAIYVKKG